VQTRIDRVVREDVDFDEGYHSVHNYLVRYASDNGVAGVEKHMKVAADNVTTFLRKYVKTTFIAVGWLKMIQNKPCLNGTGWKELMKLANLVVDNGEVRLRKK
jgi:hypothetical protein